MRDRFLLVVLAVLYVNGLPAQPTQAQCDSAAAHVVGQRLPRSGAKEWNDWYRLRTCGAGGTQAAAQQIGSVALQSETDMVRLSQFFSVFWGRRSGDLYNAMSSLALNGSATRDARVAVVTALGKISQPVFNFDASSFTRPFPAMCGLTGDDVESSGDEASLPAGYAQAIIATMTTIEGDTAAPGRVRGAAHCWKIQLLMVEPLDASKLKLLYVCGHKFRVRNTNPIPAIVTFTVGKSTERGQISAGPLGDSDFEVIHDGAVRLFYNGQEVDSKANGGTPCP